MIIGFFDRRKFVLGAVSGEAEVPKTREMSELRDRLEWVSQQEGPVAVDKYDDGWHADPEEAAHSSFRTSKPTELNGVYALPLRWSQGVLGAMIFTQQRRRLPHRRQQGNRFDFSPTKPLLLSAMRSSTNRFRSQIFSSLFAEQKKRLAAAMPKERWRLYAERAAIVAAILILVPWPVRVRTDATVVPAERRIVSSMEGESFGMFSCTKRNCATRPISPCGLTTLRIASSLPKPKPL